MVKANGIITLADEDDAIRRLLIFDGMSLDYREKLLSEWRIRRKRERPHERRPQPPIAFIPA